MENFLLGELRRAIDECGTCVAVIKLAARGDAQLRWDIKNLPPLMKRSGRRKMYQDFPNVGNARTVGKF